jgi:hypothetical protein
LDAIESYRDVVDFVRMNSESPEAVAIIKARHLAFSFVDGLHEYRNCLSDIRACSHSGLIAVDDIHWSPELAQAFTEALPERKHIDLPYLHEGWIL